MGVGWDGWTVQGGQELQEGFGSNNMLFVGDLLQLPSVNGNNVLSWSGSNIMYMYK